MSDQDEPLQQRIRQKAHQLWERSGSPEGDDQRYWFLAKAEVEQEDAQAGKEVAGDSPSSSALTGATSEAAAAGGSGMAVPDETGAVEKPARRRVK